VSSYFIVDWMGCIAGVSLWPRPVKTRGRRWTLGGQLASEVVARHRPTSGSFIYEGEDIAGQRGALVYSGAELDDLWRAESSDVARQSLSCLTFFYYGLDAPELMARYEELYKRGDYELPQDISRFLMQPKRKAVVDGTVFAFLIDFNPEYSGEGFLPSSLEELIGGFPVPLCKSDSQTNADPEAKIALYHSSIVLPDGELVLEPGYAPASSEGLYRPASLSVTYYQDIAHESEHRCTLCRTILAE